ncbi:hypothetical protein GOODEAATRI_019638 [Goodea atripinnis]|uniref:Secreted protein n=1 Tax=Goodea atripinnis TaxID=208336 RepID=A0ABV0MJ61_9TELE
MPFFHLIFASLSFSINLPFPSQPTCLSRGFVTAVKPCIMVLTHRLLPFSSTSPPLHPFFHDSPLQHSVERCPQPSSSAPSVGTLCHLYRAIGRRCCGADNSLIYLSLSSTKGPGH